MHVVGDDYTNVPPGPDARPRGMSSGICAGIRSPVTSRNPIRRAELIDAVARSEVDVGLAWGPIAGWAARQKPEPVELVRSTPTTFERGRSTLPMTFAISMGVRRATMHRVARP